MACKEFQEQLGTYFDGEVSTEEFAQVQEHVAACAECSSKIDEFGMLARGLAPVVDGAEVPVDLWPSIDAQLHIPPTQNGRLLGFWFRFPLGVRYATAAAVTLMVGAVGFGVFSRDGVAAASEINFSVLLDSLPLDVNAAFRRFVEQHKGEKSTPEQARQFASKLNFAIPSDLPGGFALKDVFILHIGSQPGVAARYDRQGEFLAAIFHPPVQKEDFGSHEDYECVVGQHRGHAVSVDHWTMVHVTDPTTCHCVLSRLNQSDLSPILHAVAPELPESSTHGHNAHSRHP